MLVIISSGLGMEGFWDLLTSGVGLTLWELVGLCGACFLGSLLTAALGLGGGVLVLAAMAVSLPPAALIPLHGVVQLGATATRSVVMWRHVLYSIIPAFVIGTILGAAIGARIFIGMPLWTLQAILGLFTLYATWAPKFRASKSGPGRFFVVGGVGAFVTMFIGASGPFIAPFVSAACANRHQMVATHSVLITLHHIAKILAFSLIGFAFAPYIPLLVALLAAGLVGTLAGGKVLDRLPEKVFRRSLNVLLTLLACRLLYSAGRTVLA